MEDIAGRQEKTELTYDEYGNLSTVTNAKRVVQSYEYDSENHQFCESISTTGGFETITSTTEYDYALQRKIREEDCNGNYFRYVYDSWGRLTELYTAYDASIPAVSYEYHTPDNDRWYTLTKNKVSFDSADAKVIETVNIIDGLGRSELTAKTGLYYDRATDSKVEGWNVNGAVIYDAKGRTVQQGMT